tara:strand:- start:31571 stop:32344 length:774 start_codon:yes stop_codon:yes gene_type:complete
MENTVHYYQQQSELRVSIEKKFKNLVQLKKEENQADFNELLLKMLPEVKKYINQRLQTAIHKGHFSKGKYKAEDFMDQLFVEVYDSIEDVSNDNEFYVWLFNKTNDLLEATIVEEEFDNLFFKNIDDYTKPEWDDMVEKYSVEADGDLILNEDLDDISYHKTNYLLKQVFIEDNEKALIEQLDKKLSDDDIDRHVKMLLHNLPASMQTVFDLFTKQSFSLHEIAVIMKRDVKEVEVLLDKARKGLYTSLFNRFLNDD